MGEIADMMIDGDMCTRCGEYLGNGGGYAQLCRGCINEEKEENRQLKALNKAKKDKKK